MMNTFIECPDCKKHIRICVLNKILIEDEIEGELK